MIGTWKSPKVRGGREEEDMLCNDEDETWDFEDFGLKPKGKKSSGLWYVVAVNEREPGKI